MSFNCNVAPKLTLVCLSAVQVVPVAAADQLLDQLEAAR